MPSQQIVNPTGAFNQPFNGQSDANGGLIGEYVAATAISSGQVVGLNTSCQLVLASSGTAKLAIGISKDTVISGQVARVNTNGPVSSAIADSSGVTAGAICKPSATAGQISGTASATIGENIGVAVTTQASGGATFILYVAKV